MPTTPPPTPPTPTIPGNRQTTSGSARRGLGGGNRGTGATELQKQHQNQPPNPQNPHQTQKRQTYALSLPPDTFTRTQTCGIHRPDLVLTALNRHSETIRNHQAHRPTQKGRKRFNINLTPQQYNQLQRLADSRNWSVSATVTTLINLYLNDLQQHHNTPPTTPNTPKPPRPQPRPHPTLGSPAS